MRQILLLTVALLIGLSTDAQTFRWNDSNSNTQPKGTSQMDSRTITARSPLADKEVESGYATYYADYLHGQPTYYGEVYQRDQLTTAHRTLPLGTLLKVTRLDNGMSVTVRVNDKAPLCDGCVVSLSYAAGEAIDLIRVGKTRVAIQTVGHSNSNPTATVTNQRLYSYNNSGYNSTLSNRQPSPPQQQATPIPSGYSYDANLPQGASTTTNYTRNPTVVPERRTVQSRSAAVRSEQPSSYDRPEYNLPYRSNTTTARAGTTAPVPAPAAATTATRLPSTNTTNTGAPNRMDVRVLTNNPSGYGVQLGAYSNYGNAQRQVISLQERGLKEVFIREDRRADGSVLNRVVVGPFPTIGSAQQQLQQIQSQFSLKGIVMRLQ